MKKYSVFLRAFKVEDAIKINEWRNSEEIVKLTCGRFRYVGINMEQSWVQNKILNNSNEEYLAICLNDDSKEMIGYQCIRNIDNYNRSAHAAGIVIDPAYQNGIYMVDAFLLLLEYAFVHIGLNRLVGSCLRIHKDSRIMMEMLGFTLEGIARKSLYKHHEYLDVCKYAILYDEYEEIKQQGGYSLLSIAKRANLIRKSLKYDNC